VNRLGGETSPYLRQHAENPVDWYPWGLEALETAERLDRPIFLSIGYSACHWCHVMAHESFEDPATAEYLNERFVSIKVDREERPDVDAVYMDAVQAMTGQGGWPMTVFCTPDGKPFFGGTYFPLRRAHGRPSFRELLEAIEKAWSGRREAVLEQASDLSDAVARGLAVPTSGRPTGDIGPAEVAAMEEAARDRLAQTEDEVHGGLGRAPKFPQPPLLELLLRSPEPGSVEVATRALDGMARGGIYDHLGGGFARYSVDRIWRVPHFEKMLYDQAGLARAYLHAWQLTGDASYRQVLDETVGYVIRDMTIEAGGVHAAEDADSEGEEGLFYTWTPKELVDAVGPGGAVVAGDWYGVTETGDLDGRSVLHRPQGAPLARPAEIEELCRRLFEVRGGRVRPGRDDKVLTEWNAMWCSTLAEAAGATGEESWAAAALSCAEFLLAELRRPDGRWLRSWQDGRSAHLAYSADHAWLVDCFSRLAELTGQIEWIERARETAGVMIDLFFEPGVGLYTTARDSEPLFVRPREIQDGVIPAASSVAVVALSRLAALTADESLARTASDILSCSYELLEKAPTAVPVLLHGADLVVNGPVEVVVTGDRPDLVAEARKRFLPSGVLTHGAVAVSQPVPPRPTGRAFVCRGRTCSAPISEPEELAALLGQAES
jgi:uncharacterized protein YyaL (SSP411 family)